MTLSNAQLDGNTSLKCDSYVSITNEELRDTESMS